MSAEEIILRRLKAAHPDIEVLSEETHSRQSTDTKNSGLSIIDNEQFPHTIPQYSVSIAYAEKGEVLGVPFTIPQR